MAESRAKVKEIYNESGTFYYAAKYSCNHEDMSEGHQSQIKGTLTSQIWDNLFIKIDNNSNGLYISLL
jgi:hypothetical protein